jgi:hypothetical protein
LLVRVSTCAVESNTPESTENPFDQLATFIVAGIVFQSRRDPDMTGLDEVGHEYPRHPDRNTQLGGYLGDGRRLPAQLHDGRFEVVQFELPLHGDRMRCNEGLQRQLDRRPGAAGSQRVRANETRLGAPHAVIVYVHPTIRNPS